MSEKTGEWRSGQAPQRHAGPLSRQSVYDGAEQRRVTSGSGSGSGKSEMIRSSHASSGVDPVSVVCSLPITREVR